MSLPIKIYSKNDNRDHAAAFDAVRSCRGYTLGWAAINAPYGVLRIPAILTPFQNTNKRGGGDCVVTVADWQADYSHIDLSDPADISRLSRTGCGAFCNPATNRESGVWQHFA